MENEILDSIEILDEKSNYWFVRTDSGQYFDTFFKNGFIAIGWNEISLEDLESSETEVKNKIARFYKLDLKMRSDKGKATDIYNKILRLNNLKRNDVIIIPSENSEYIAFGIIDDDNISEVFSEMHDCPYIKRRKVKWVVGEPKSFDSLDDVFYKIKKSRHAISIVNEYADYIDSAMYSVYKKDDSSHFVINVKQRGVVNWLELATTLLELHKLMAEINLEFGLNENVGEGSIQIALQSPGLFNLRQKGVALILLATVLGASSCSNLSGRLPESDRKKLDNIKEIKADTISSLKARLVKMDVNL